ncbi:hypothetical protein NMY22_g15991 [Coprinellus aureogranulatus]|nr:hypothetical protein NMY22_g15991 [Coprinellus aureogranulatus]
MHTRIEYDVLSHRRQKTDHPLTAMDIMRDVLVMVGVLAQRGPNIARLLKSNDRLTNQERELCVPRIASLRRRILDLKARVRATQDMRTYLPMRTLSHLRTLVDRRRVRRLQEIHKRYRGFLSAVRDIPVEVWQKIFFFVAFPEETHFREETSRSRHDHEEALHLYHICLVSRLWWLAATTFPLLWTRIPGRYTKISGTEWRCPGIPNITRLGAIRRYLSLSKKELIGFHLSMPRHPEYSEEEDGQTAVPIYPPTYSRLAVEVLELLVAHSSRWSHVHMELDVEVATMVLGSVAKEFPRLISLDFIVIYPNTYEGGCRTFRCFSAAPALQEAHLEQYWQEPTNGLVNEGWMTVHLPWSQLVRYEANSQSGLLCKEMIQGATLLHLGTLRWTPTGFRMCDEMLSRSTWSQKITLPALHTLEFFPHTSSQVSYLAHLLLPSLARLTVEAYRDRDLDIGDKVVDLLERSGCSLTSLRLLLRETHNEFKSFSKICALSPHLRTLAIGATSIEMLSVAEPNTPILGPILPQLQTLIIVDDREVRGAPMYSFDQAKALKDLFLEPRTGVYRHSDKFELHFDECDWRYLQGECDELMLQLFYLTGHLPGQKLNQRTTLSSLKRTYKAGVDAAVVLVYILDRLLRPLEGKLAKEPYADDVDWEYYKRGLERAMKRFDEIGIDFWLREADPIFRGMGVVGLLHTVRGWKPPGLFANTSEMYHISNNLQSWAESTLRAWEEDLFLQDKCPSRPHYQWNFPVGGTRTSVIWGECGCYTGGDQRPLESCAYRVNREYCVFNKISYYGYDLRVKEPQTAALYNLVQHVHSLQSLIWTP